MAKPDPMTIESNQAEIAGSLSGHALRGSVIIGSAQLVRVSVQFLSVVILSRLLSPQDFGLVACVSPVIAFVSMFQDLGYGQAIVQSREISQEQISSIFWTTAALGLVCAVTTVLASPGVAWFFHDSRLVLLTIGASVSVMLGSLTAVPGGLLNRRLQFRGLALSDGLAALIGLVSAVAAALAGARYWSLIISTIATSVATVVGYWATARWRPSRPRWRTVDREIGSFGANLTGFTFVSYFARNLDNVLIGRKLGSIELGFYDRAFKLLSFPIQNINGPLYSVMTPLLSRVQDDRARFRAMFLRSAGQLTLLLVPAMAGLVAASQDAVVLVFGPRWEPVAPIFFYLGIVGMVQPLTNATGWILIAQGRTDVMLRLGIITSAITASSFFLGLHFGGAVGLAAAYAIAECLLKAPIQYGVLHRVGPVTFGDFCRMQIPLLLAAGSTIAIVRFVLSDMMELHGILHVATALALSYALAIVVTATRPSGRMVLKESWGLARRLGRRREG